MEATLRIGNNKTVISSAAEFKKIVKAPDPQVAMRDLTSPTIVYPGVSKVKPPTVINPKKALEALLGYIPKICKETKSGYETYLRQVLAVVGHK